MRVFTLGVMTVVAEAFAVLVFVVEDMMSLSGFRRCLFYCLYLFFLSGLSDPRNARDGKTTEEIIFFS